MIIILQVFLPLTKKILLKTFVLLFYIELESYETAQGHLAKDKLDSWSPRAGFFLIGTNQLIKFEEEKKFRLKNYFLFFLSIDIYKLTVLLLYDIEKLCYFIL